MKMTLSRKFELVGGVATGVLGLVAPFCKHGAHTFELFRLWPGLLLGDLVSFVVPGFLVAISSYIHTRQEKTLGFVMLMVGGIFLIVASLMYFFGGVVFYAFGLWGGIMALSQSVMAIATVISSLVVVRDPLDS